MICLPDKNIPGLIEKNFRPIETGITIQTTLNGEIIKKLCTTQEKKRETVKFITRIIERYTQQLNTYKDSTNVQNAMLAMDLIELFENETIEDIILMFKKARQGQYGFRARFDSTVVMEWIPKYLEEKAKAREHKKENEKAQRDLEEIRNPMSDKTKKMLRAFIQRSAAHKAQGKRYKQQAPPIDSIAYFLKIDARPPQMSIEQWEKLKQDYKQTK